MPGATQLSIYNKALRHLEERKLSSLSEPREPRRYLDDEYPDAVLFVLSDGFWKAAMRNDKIDASTTQGPNFGYKFAFPKPGDWVRTYQVADNEGFNPLLRRYDDSNNVWYADISPIYVKFVSNDPNFGLNMALWTPGMVEYLSAYLAWLCAPRLKQSGDKVDRLEKLVKRKRADALAKDAMDLPPGQPPFGTWIQSRAPRGSILPYGNPFPGSLD
jgi:hypothetical protein